MQLKNRRIPYGYKMVMGKIVVNDTENKILQKIFNDYANGSTYKRIATELTEKKIQYALYSYNWNSSRIKRIIEDERYLGNEIYPKLIDKELFDRANNMKRMNTKNTVGIITSDIKPFVYSVRCGECYSPLPHITDRKSKHPETWKCKICDNCSHIIVKQLISEVTDILNIIIADPNLIENQISTTNQNGLDIVRMENDIQRKLDQIDVDSNELKDLILECASQKYTSNSTTLHITERLKAELQKTSSLSAFSIDLYNRIATSTLIGKDEAVSLMLKNGQVIGKDEQNANGNQTSHDYPGKA